MVERDVILNLIANTRDAKRGMTALKREQGTLNDRVRNYDRATSKGFNNYNRRAKQATQQTNALGGQIGKIGGLIGGAFAADAVLSYVTATVQAQAETNRLAGRLDIGVESLQEFQFVAQQFGISQDALRDGFKELSLRTDEFIQTGVGPAAEAFERLGLSVEELNEVSGDTEALFELVQSRIQGVGNAAARQRIADELFGGQGGEQFIELLKASNTELDNMRQEARDVGAVVSKETSQQMEDLATSFDTLKAAISGTSGNILGEFAPALEKMIGGLTSAVEHTDDLITLFKTGVKASLGTATREDFNAAFKSGKDILGLTNEINKNLAPSIAKGLGGLAPGPATGGTKEGALAQNILEGGGGGDTGRGTPAKQGPAPTLSGAGQFSFQGATFTPKGPTTEGVERQGFQEMAGGINQVKSAYDGLVQTVEETSVRTLTANEKMAESVQAYGKELGLAGEQGAKFAAQMGVQSQSAEEAANKIIDTLIARIVTQAISSVFATVPFPANLAAAPAAAIAAKGLQSLIPEFETGIDNFGGGMAKVHKGEVITNLPSGANVINNENVEKMDEMGVPITRDSVREGMVDALSQVQLETNNKLQGSDIVQSVRLRLKTEKNIGGSGKIN